MHGDAVTGYFHDLPAPPRIRHQFVEDPELS